VNSLRNFGKPLSGMFDDAYASATQRFKAWKKGLTKYRADETFSAWLKVTQPQYDWVLPKDGTLAEISAGVGKEAKAKAGDVAGVPKLFRRVVRGDDRRATTGI